MIDAPVQPAEAETPQTPETPQEPSLRDRALDFLMADAEIAEVDVGYQATINAANWLLDIETRLESIRAQARANKTLSGDTGNLVDETMRLLAQRDYVQQTYPEARRLMIDVLIPERDEQLRATERAKIEQNRRRLEKR